MKEALNFIIENWYWLSPVVLEILLRLLPSERDTSILSNLFKILNKVVPNIRKPKTEDRAALQNDGTLKNTVHVNTKRHIIPIVLLLVSFSSFGQIWPSYKGVSLVNATDSTSVIATRSQNGSMYYNTQSGKFRVYENGVWKDMTGTGGAGGGLQAADNGLTQVGNVVEFGGTLTNLTTGIDLDGNSFTITNGSPGTGTLSFSNHGSNLIDLGNNGDAQYEAVNLNFVGSSQFNITSPDFTSDNDDFTVNTTGGITLNGTGITSVTGSHIEFTGKGEFNPTVTTSPINLGIIAGDPSALVNGDMWYNSATGKIRGRQGGSSVDFGNVQSLSNGLTLSGSGVGTLGGPLTGTTTISGAQTLNFTNTTTEFTGTNANFGNTAFKIYNPAGTFRYTLQGAAILADRTIGLPVTSASTTMMVKDATTPFSTRVIFSTAVDGVMTTDPNFTFNTSGDVLTTGAVVLQTTTTIPAVDLGGATSDPSSLSDGDLWYRSDTDLFRGRANGSTVSLGIVAGATNEFPKVTSGQYAASGWFSTSAGQFVLTSGEGLTAGSNAVTLQYGGSGATLITSSTASTDVNITTQNASHLNIQAGNGNGFDVNITGSDGNSGNNNGGDVKLESGPLSGAGVDGNVVIETLNNTGTFKMNDGANEQMGIATLVGGTVTVNNTKVTANTRIFYSVNIAGGTQGFLRISARTAGTSFTITSTSGTETSTVVWMLVEPN